MAEKDVEHLEKLFHESAQFVHMGGYWGKEEELRTIKEGGIWYKKAEIHSQEVYFASGIATVYSRIHLNSGTICVFLLLSLRYMSFPTAVGNWYL